MKRAILLAALLLATGTAWGEEGMTPEGFLRMGESGRSWFAGGFAAGMAFASPKNSGVDCIWGKTFTQISAVVTKYLNDHPDMWHYSIQDLMAISLLRWCKDLAKTSGGRFPGEPVQIPTLNDPLFPGIK